MDEVIKAARNAAESFLISDTTTRELTVALINYQAAQMITEQLVQINARLSDINENIWRGQSK